MNQALIQRALARVMPAARATGLFSSLCTIQQPSGVFTQSGQPDGVYVAVSGLVNIPCTNPPTSNIRITANEKRTIAEIKSDNSNHVLLDDYFPQIDALQRNGAQAVVDGITYTILGVESDSQEKMTRLNVEKCTI